MNMRYYNIRLACIGMFFALSLSQREPQSWMGATFAFIFTACWICDGIIEYIEGAGDESK